ncbi:hypothetical protein J6590_089429 [Homalodisca vitripennis]|nr:hypothetical protein J6590_089429 [Homalodisca vitripennis]
MQSAVICEEPKGAVNYIELDESASGRQSPVISGSQQVRAVSINSLPSQRSYLLTYPSDGTLTVYIT